VARREVPQPQLHSALVDLQKRGWQLFCQPVDLGGERAALGGEVEKLLRECGFEFGQVVCGSKKVDRPLRA
jgi:hypothetical protein